MILRISADITIFAYPRKAHRDAPQQRIPDSGTTTGGDAGGSGGDGEGLECDLKQPRNSPEHELFGVVGGWG